MFGVFSVVLLSLACSSVHATFPTGRCYSHSCEATPFDISWVSQTPAPQNRNIACFKVTSKSCFDSTNLNCCEGFESLLHKIKLATSATCERSVVSVTVNGTKKGGGIYFEKDDDHSELILTTLRIPGSKAVNTEFCLTLQPPCNTIEQYCVEPRSGLCKFAIYNDPGHACCPSCIMLDKSFESETVSSADSPHLPPNPDQPPNPEAPNSPSPSLECQDCCDSCSCSCP